MNKQLHAYSRSFFLFHARFYCSFNCGIWIVMEFNELIRRSVNNVVYNTPKEISHEQIIEQMTDRWESNVCLSRRHCLCFCVSACQEPVLMLFVQRTLKAKSMNTFGVYVELMLNQRRNRAIGWGTYIYQGDWVLVHDSK